MLLFLKLYATAVAAFVALDGLWIGFIARGFYGKHLGYLLGPFKIFPAALFYLMYAAGLVYLIMLPMLEKPIWHVFLAGALVGLMAYGAYDFTNQATLRDWPWIVTVVDIAWGVFASGAVASIVVWVARTFFI